MLKIHHILLVLLVLTTAYSSVLQAQVPIQKKLIIGLVADIQYADKQAAGSRYYSESPQKLAKVIQDFNAKKVDLTIDLGDRIDEGYKNFDRIDQEFLASNSPVVFVPGNHDYAVRSCKKRRVTKKTGNAIGYSSSMKDQVHLVYLNGLKESLIAYSPLHPTYHRAKKTLALLKEKKEVNAYNWNGGLGEKQFKWLQEEAIRAKKNNVPLLIFCHQPIFKSNGHNLWDYKKVRTFLTSLDIPVWWISGHDHKGGQEQFENLTMLTLSGLVEKDDLSYGILTIQDSTIQFDGQEKMKGVRIKTKR